MRYLKYLLLGAPLLLIACSDMGEKKEPLQGERLSAYAVTPPVMPDNTISSKKYTAPAAISTTWSASKYPAEAMGHNLSLSIEKLKRIRAFDLSASRYSSITTPVISASTIFTVDNAGHILAASIATGKTTWRNDDLLKNPALTKLLDKKKMLFGGMLLHEDKLFLTAGFKGIIALDATSGKTLWYKELSTMVRGVPMYAHEKIIVQAANNNVFALDAAKGDLVWSYWGAKGSDIIPLDSPVLALYKNKVISAQAGNVLHAIDLATGEQEWETSFYEAYEDAAALFAVSANQMQLALLDGRIIASHPAGRIMAINPENGAPVWKQDLDSGQSFWIAGNLLFTTTKGDSLVALDNSNGKVKWIASLASFVPQAKKGKTSVTWLQQPIVAGGEVLLASSNGQLHRFDYNDGKYLGAKIIADSAIWPPIVAGDQLFIPSKNGLEQLATPASK